MIETSSNEEKRNRERGDTSMKYGFGVFLTCMMFYLCGSSVYGAVTDYETVVQNAEIDIRIGGRRTASSDFFHRGRKRRRSNCGSL